MKKFKYGTGLMGATELGQKVTAKNIHLLPEGSVIRTYEEDDDAGTSRIIHLHDRLWLWISSSGCAWCYDDIERMKTFLNKSSVVCHLAPEK